MHIKTIYQVKSLKQDNLTKAVEAVAVMVFSLFATVLLPSLIFRFFYADQTLLEQPKVLEYIPIAAFALGAGYFIFAMVGNFLRSRKVRQLETQLEIEMMDCHSDGMMLKGMEKMASKKIAKSKKLKKTNKKK